ncbi:DUF417 family protein [Neisseria chenwenguii]|uniref:Uncharacterized protein n=1 Tax=Neisseria chenwenguii TaxID=1853278 RepID=A0A220S2K8_9NEIS|nr:DUF417 family protein [Neisseria chenwenguii]ASK27633.1 hypothetical protein BG910_07645 [Neisseria chenwenguii]ROV54437.1 DUF417 family protein [Neisseria chenwenguii]
MKTLCQRFQQSDIDIAVLRFSVIFIIALFGIYKWFDFEVEALKPLISGSWLNFLYTLFGFHGASYFLGVVEGIAYIALALGYVKPKIGVVGDLLVILIGVVTLSTLPQVGMDSFIVKDIILLGAGLVLLKHDFGKVKKAQVIPVVKNIVE